MWNLDCTIATIIDALLAVIACVGSMVMMFALRSKWKPWYDSLKKAPWTPPDWVFAVVWTLLYISLAAAGITARYYYEQPVNTTTFAVNVASQVLYYAMWLGLLIWAPVFFFARALVLSLSLLTVILLASIATDALFWVIRFVPGLLMIPYLIWLLYALSLSVYIVVHNGSGTKLKLEEFAEEQREEFVSDLIGSTRKNKNGEKKGARSALL